MRTTLARHTTLLALTAGLGLASGLAHAEAATRTLGDHPAVLQQHGLRGIDANSFRVGHPASPLNRAGHANHDHPAVTLARETRNGVAPVLDANTFIVQPPASTHWTDGPAATPAVALLQR